MDKQSHRVPVRYSIDGVRLRNCRLLMWGWLFAPDRGITSAQLRVSGKGWETVVPVETGSVRPDLSSLGPGALFAGFYVTAFLEGAEAREASLEVHCDDGSRTDIDISQTIRGKWDRSWRRQAAAAWRSIRAGEWMSIAKRFKAVATTRLDASNARRVLAPWLARRGGTTVAFDHDMGGGANQYRRGLVERATANGGIVLLVTYRVAELGYRLEAFSSSGTSIFELENLDSVMPILASSAISEIVVNSPVSFDDPAGFAATLAGLRARHDTPLVVMVHDYFTICRSYVLLDASGKFCGVPDISGCDDCMARNKGRQMFLSPPTSIARWRSSWGLCLAVADEIRCFSDSSRDLLLRAYPDLPRERITVVPHNTDDITFRPAKYEPAAPLVIGILGQVNAFKGAGIVADLARMAEASPGDVRIVVIGTLEPPFHSPRLAVTGRYRRDELPALVERHGVNMLFFPSIWPETFSYVVAEMMALRLPIVAFDLGAPAERLAGWPLARLCKSIDARAAFETLLSYHREHAEQAA